MKILFLCTHNACRSILAEAVARRLGGERWQVASAGSQPAGHVHPLTLRYLAEAGYEVADLKSKSWDDLKGFQPDVVITVCDQAAGESCPVWLGKAVRVHWGLVDPSFVSGCEEAVALAFRNTIALLERRLGSFLENDLGLLSSPDLQRILVRLGAEK